MPQAKALAGKTLPVTFGDILAARDVIGDAIVNTPCLESRTLGQMIGTRLWLKFENLQFTASFKDRGALNRLSDLTDGERKRGVIAMSAGNHAQGVAYHARRLGIPATIVMPEATPLVKVMGTEAHGAKVVLYGASLEESAAHAHALKEEGGLTFIHPYDDVRIIAGQGTVALEMLEAIPDLDVLVVPIGGGGLISGIAIAAKTSKPGIEIIGVQSRLCPSMYAALRGEALPLDVETLAEGIAVKAPGRLTRDIVDALVDDVVLVSEAQIERAISLLLTIEKTLVEGAGAASLAAVLDDPARFEGRRVGLILCGGNIDTRLLTAVLQRELARAGRLARLRIRIKDRPGQLGRLTEIVGRNGGNIVEVAHQRIFTDLPAKAAYLIMEVETRDRPHLDTLIGAIREAGYEVQRLDFGGR